MGQSSSHPELIGSSTSLEVFGMDPINFSGSASNPATIFDTGPWKINPEGNYCYLSEFFDGDVVRIDKSGIASAGPTDACRDPAGQDNPCLDQIYVTHAMKDIQVHGDRLYFAGYSEFGYIVLNTWSPGSIYTGLESKRDPIWVLRGPFHSGDMSIGPDGMVTLNDYVTRSVYRLYTQ